MNALFPSALLFFSAVVPILSQDHAGPRAEGEHSGRGVVYAKIILPLESPSEGKQPSVERWIARRLRKHGMTELRAVTGWIRLSEKGEGWTDIWNATLDGESCGCPVQGKVNNRTAAGMVRVTLSGWAPFPARITGNSLPAGIGSRSIAVVDPGQADGRKVFVALLIAPAGAR